MRVLKYLGTVMGLCLAVLFSHAAINNQSPAASMRQFGEAMGATDGASSAAAAATYPLKGPGLGNLTYTQDELFKPVSLIQRDAQGVPETYPGRKDYGLNAAMMHNGYFVTLFAPDSGDGPGGFLIYDISNPRAPALVKRIYEPEGRTAEFREAHSFGSATINNRNYIAIATTKGVEFWDFTDINNVQQVRKVALPTVDRGDYTNVSWQLWWQAPYLYVASANDGIYIVDARDPASASIAERGAGRPNPVPTGELGGFRVGTIFTMGNHMVISSMESTDGVASLDISDPLNPKVLDTVPSVPFYYATCFDGRRVFGSVRGYGARMFGYDLADRSRFVADDNRLVVDEQLYCATQDHHVFQGAQYAMHKIDVSNPQQHVQVGVGSLYPAGDPHQEHADHGQVAPFGNLVFIGNDHGTGSGFMVHATAPDTTAPAVRQISPANGAGQQALTSRVGIALTDSILPDSVTASTFVVRPVGGNTLAGTYSVQLGIVNFFPAQPLSPNTAYEILLPAGGLKDYAGNAIATDFHARFTTGNALDIGLAHYWTLGRNLLDPIGHNNGTASASDAFGSIGLNFAQRSAGVALADDNVASVLAGTSSLSFYLRTTQVGKDSAWLAPGIFGRDQAGGDNDVFWGWLDAGGRINLSVGNQGGGNPGTRSASPVNDGNWHHIVLTRDAASGVQAIHVDGVKVTSQGRTGALGLNNRFQMLGQIQGNPDFMRGTLADVRVYNRVLGDADVAALRNTPVVGDPGLGAGAKLVNGQLAFNPTVLGGSAQYSWNFGNGQRSAFSSQARINYTYASPGHYTVTLTVRGTDGSETYYTHQVTVIHPVTTTSPTHTTNIAGDASTVYSLDPDSGTVAAIHAQNMTRLWETKVGRGPRTLAVGPDGRVWVTVQDEDKLVALDAASGNVALSVPLAYGSGPYGVAFTPDRAKGVLTLEHKSALVTFDPSTGNTTGTLPLAGAVRGIAVSSDSAVAYVTRFMSASTGAQLHKVNLQSLALTRTIGLQVDTTTVDDESRARGVPNHLAQAVISPDGRRVALPSKKDNILRGLYRDGRRLEHDRTVRSILSQVDVVQAAEVPGEQLDFDDRAPARAAAFAPSGDYIFVAQMEGNRVAIVDAYTRAVRGEIADVGLAPHGLYLDASRKRLFVNNFLSRSVTVHDVAQVLSSESAAATRLQAVTTVAQEPLSASALRGKQVFYNAADRRMSRDNYMSCASCHADGGSDGMVWDFTQRGEGLRRTPSLLGRQGTGHGRMHWSGNFDEVQDFENDIRGQFGGTGFMADADFAATAEPLGAAKAGRSAALDDLANYLASLSRYSRSPARNTDGSLTVNALRGRDVFASLQCASCHSGINFTDSQRRDVGTIQASSGKGSNQSLAGIGFDTPTLLDAWSSPNFFHNGQAASLLDVFASGHGNASSLSASDSAALGEYVRSLDARSARLRMRSNHSNLCANVRGASAGSGATVIQWPCGDGTNEQFDVNNIDGFQQFVFIHSGLCLAQADTASTGGALAQLACGTGAATQWKRTGAVLRNRASGACLDVPNASQAQDVPLATWSCNNGNNQNWTLGAVNQ